MSIATLSPLVGSVALSVLPLAWVPYYPWRGFPGTRATSSLVLPLAWVPWQISLLPLVGSVADLFPVLGNMASGRDAYLAKSLGYDDDGDL